MDKYKILKNITIFLQVFNVPFSIYTGAMLVLENKVMFIVGLSISMTFVFVQANLWWMTMENLKKDGK